MLEHPEIFVPIKDNEIDFFSWRYNKGFDWYNTLFEEATDGQVIGEISPRYLSVLDHPVAKRIYEFQPKMKLIITLRNPVERAYSHYHLHLRSNEGFGKPEEEILEGTEYFDYSLYYDSIQRFLKYFPRDNMIFMIYDDLESQPKAYLTEVFSFLGVDPEFEPSMIDRKFHAKKLDQSHRYCITVV